MAFLRQWIDKAFKVQLREVAWNIAGAVKRDDLDDLRLAAELVHHRQGSLAYSSHDLVLVDLTWKALCFHDELHNFLAVKLLQKVEFE